MTQPADHKFPTREQIRQAMIQKLGSAGPIFAPLVSTVAEVSESIMLKTWRTLNDREAPENEVEIKKKGKRCVKHYCSSCGYQNVHPVHHYCPGCGTKIKWITQ